MARVRRKFVCIHPSQGSLIAEEAIAWIVQLCAVEREARGFAPDHGRAELPRAHAAPTIDDLERCRSKQLSSISEKHRSRLLYTKPWTAWIVHAPTLTTASSNWTTTWPNEACVLSP